MAFGFYGRKTANGEHSRKLLHSVVSLRNAVWFIITWKSLGLQGCRARSQSPSILEIQHGAWTVVSDRGRQTKFIITLGMYIIWN